MRKLLQLAAIAAIIATFFQCSHGIKTPGIRLSEISLADNEEKEEKEDGIRLAMEMEFEMTKDVSLGYVPKNRLVNALDNLMRERNGLNGRLTGINTLSWTERGPNTDTTGPSNGNTRAGNAATSGRMRAIWVDLADATNHTVWAGGVDGGVWKTTNISTAPATWTLVNDFFSNLAIASICQSPAGTKDTMYFGTGEKCQSSFFIVQGGGVWKSTNHGASWSILPSTTNFFNVSKVVCDASGFIYVSVIPSLFGLGSTGGIYRSTDGGTSWTNITPAGLSSNVTEMKLSSTGRLHIVCGYSSSGTPDPAPGYRYTDNPSTVTSGSGWNSGAGFPSPQFNCELAVSSNTLYALNANSSFQTPTIYKSTDGGANWAPTATSPPAAGGTNDLSSGQGWYNLEAVVDPANGNNVIVGGLNCYRSSNGGTTWTQASVWVGTTGQYVHADQHTGVWNGSQVLIGSDGGIFYSADGGVTFSDRNTGLRLKQFYSCAIHPTLTNYFLAGAQDNGTHALNNPGLSGSTEVTGGDGAFVHIDQDEPQYQYGSYVFSQYRRSIDGGSTWSPVNFSSSVGQFINPTAFDDGNNKMYTSGAVGQYIRWEDPHTGSTFTPVAVAALGSNTVRSITVSPYTSNRVFFGNAGGRVVQVDNANTNSPAGNNITGAGMPATIVSSIAIGTNDNNLIATYSNYGSAHVWVTTTGGGSAGWTNISGNLPDIPVRWAMFYPDDNTKAILGTEMGVYETLLINGSSTVWTNDPSFPTVLTSMLRYRKSDGTILAATHGRGLWTATIPFTSPAIRFSSAYRTQAETSTSTSGCRRYTDYTVNMTIDAAPAGDANITVNVAGGATATQGVDFDFTTNGNFASPSNTFTFTSGSTAPKTITIRIYDDAEVEGTESFTLNYSIGGATNALAAPSCQSYTFTITDNDAAPVTPFTGNFSVGTFNATINSQTPFRSNLQKFRLQSLFTAAELQAAGLTSASNLTAMTMKIDTKNSTQPYTGFTISMANTGATNLSTGFISPTFTQVFSGSYSSVVGDNTFTFSTPFAWDGSSNVVVNFCFDNAPGAADALSDITEGTVAPLGTGIRASTYSSSVAGSGCSLPAAFISDARITATFTANAGTQIETILNSNKSEYIGNNGAYYFYVSPSGNIINSITNVSANLGCVSSNIFEAGNTWQSFSGGFRSQKVFEIIPTANSGATYTVGIYFTAAELSTYSGTPGTLRMAKTTAATMAAANSGNTIIAGSTSFTPFGTGYLFTATFTGFSKFFLIDAGVSLPVTLLSFSGHLDNKTIPLDWSTSQELNSSHFEIEKSTNGSDFHYIGGVMAAGSSSSQRNYNFIDRNVNEFNYYRLKVVDIDGRFTYSPIILIRNPDAVQAVRVVNNPFRSYIDVRFAKMPKEPVQLELLNIAGARVYYKEYGMIDQVRFDLSGIQLSAGTYLLRARVDGQVYTSKVVKQ
ncbi:MAG: T9SS type A sorting domain-containing protein [Bacteroidota bacterium]|nr:T9SS type A sorting domain-containing protein [Bacteroidota bacterium]